MKSLVFFAVALLLLVITSFPQDSTARAEKSGLTVAGRVVNSRTHDPVPRAVVILRASLIPGSDPLEESSAQSVKADNEGRFTIHDVKPGEYQIHAERPGFTSASQQTTLFAPSRGIALTVTAGRDPAEVELGLVPSAVIAGRILDQDGEPVPSAQVIALKRMFAMGRYTVIPGKSVKTDDNGEFRLFGLSKGTYFVAAGQNTGLGDSGEEMEALFSPGSHTLTFSPGVYQFADAQPVLLQPGDETHINIQLLPPGKAKVSGKVVGLQARNMKVQDRDIQLPGMVVLMPDGMGMLGILSGSHGNVDKDGAFHLTDVAPGKYTLLSMSFGSEEGREPKMASMAIVVGDSDVHDLVLAPHALGSLKGQMLLESGGAADWSGLSVTLLPAEESSIGGMGQAAVGKDGSFSLQASPGHAHILVNAIGDTGDRFRDWYMVSASLNGKDALSDGLDPALDGPGSLQIVADTKGATVKGTIVDGKKPVAGATVFLIPEKSRRSRVDLYATSKADAYGNFTLYGVAPGDYKAFAWRNPDAMSAEGNMGPVIDPDLLDQIDSGAPTISVKRGGSSTIAVEIQPD
jgi:protocatechuate 3,4-dioxygenase beta subunit